MSTTDNTPNATTPDDGTPRDTAPRDTTPDAATLADEVFTDTTREPDEGSARPTTALPVTPSPQPVTSAPATTAVGTTAVGTASTATATRTATPVATAPDDGPWIPGASPFAIVLGLLGLLLAGAVLVGELTDLTFPWADLGPWTVVAAGLVIVLVGAIGLRSSRRTQG